MGGFVWGDGNVGIEPFKIEKVLLALKQILKKKKKRFQ